MLGVGTERSTEPARPNSDWIWEHANALFKYARIKFDLHGRGVVVIDRSNILVPPKYMTLEEINQNNLTVLTAFAERYNPQGGFAILLIGKEGESTPYRVDIEPLNLPSEAQIKP